MWEKVSANVFKDDNPYGTGAFQIKGNQIISFKLAEAETVFKPDSAEYTEPWMNDIDEQLNRRTVRVLTGTLNGTVRRVFEKPAQSAAWWLSPDWNVIYVSAGWMDYHYVPVQDTPQLTKLFKSTDQGQTWRQLNWPEDADIGQITFLDTRRGYIVGWGPHIWRTADGGESWTEIPVPSLAKDPVNSRKKFDLATLGKDGVLRFTFTIQNSQQRESQIYSLGWDDEVPSLTLALPGQTVADLIDYQSQLYILTWRGTSFAEVNKAPLQTSIFRFAKQRVELLHEFTEGFRGAALYMTPGGGILMGGEDMQSYSGMTALSYDQGKSWKMERGGGNYYDPETGTIWRASIYSLYKRQIP